MLLLDISWDANLILNIILTLITFIELLGSLIIFFFQKKENRKHNQKMQEYNKQNLNLKKAQNKIQEDQNKIHQALVDVLTEKKEKEIEEKILNLKKENLVKTKNLLDTVK